MHLSVNEVRAAAARVPGSRGIYHNEANRVISFLVLGKPILRKYLAVVALHGFLLARVVIALGRKTSH